MSGFVGDLSAEQQTALDEFKSQLAAGDQGEFKGQTYDCHPDDYTALRFLRARKFDTAAAVEMYRKTLIWRKNERIDTILEDEGLKETLTLYEKSMPHAHYGFDKEGRPCYINRVGHALLGVLTQHVTVDEVLRCHLWDMEYGMRRCREQTAKLGRQVDTVVNIMDLEGLGLAHRFMIPYLKAISRVDEDNYPETLGRTIIVNAPWVFPTLWGLVKVFLDPVVASKVEVLGADWKEVLVRDYFDPASLPTFFGGTSEVAIPEFKEEDVLAEQNAKEPKDQKTEAIGAGSKFTLPLLVQIEKAEGEPQVSEVSWWFKTDNDISFSVEWLPNVGAKKFVVEAAKVNSHQIAVRGNFQTTEPGQIQFVWDNYHSWMTAKELRYTISVRSIVKIDAAAEPAN